MTRGSRCAFRLGLEVSAVRLFRGPINRCTSIYNLSYIWQDLHLKLRVNNMLVLIRQRIKNIKKNYGVSGSRKINLKRASRGRKTWGVGRLVVAESGVPVMHLPSGGLGNIDGGQISLQKRHHMCILSAL